MNIGENIKMYRKSKGLTQKELAMKSGVAEITIRQYESGKRIPKSIQLLCVADALGVSPFKLYGINEPDTFNNGRISFLDENGESNLVVDPLELQDVVNNMVHKVHPTKQSTLISDFNKLNYKGQNEALKQVKLLTKIPEYKKTNDTQVSTGIEAARSRNDPGEIDDMLKHDQEFLNNPDL